MPGSEYVIKYVKDISDVIHGIQTIGQFNKNLSAEMIKDFGQVSKIIGTSLEKVTTSPAIKGASGEILKQAETYKTLGTVVGHTSGKFSEITEKQLMVNGTFKTMSASIKDVTGQFGRTNVETEKGKKNFLSLAENIGRLATRALITIPVWIALRGAIMGSISAVKNSFAGIIEFDRVLQKLKKSLQGTPEEIDKNFSRAKDTITRFSVETGKSVNDITKAIQRFATVGFDFETAMSAGLDATRLSILLFGEAEETANAFARGLRVLVTDINDSKKSQEEIARAMALTSELYETNAFELSELSGGFEKFAGTAKSLGFTLEQTLVLLAGLSTRGLNAERAGTLLRTSSLKLAQNLGSVAKVLGVQVNPEMDKTFDIFMKVVNAIAQLKKGSNTISTDVASAVRELFGGTRGGEPILDIVADMEQVNIAFNKFLSARPDIIKFRTDVDDMNKSLFRQVEIYHNLNKEIGKAFITGVTGAEDFEIAITRINEALKVIGESSEKWGAGLTGFFQALTLQYDKSAETILGVKGRIEARIVQRFRDLAKLGLEGFKSGMSEAELQEAFKATAELRVDVQKNNLDDSYLQNLTRIESAFIKIASTNRKVSDENEKIIGQEDTINSMMAERVDFQKNEAYLKDELKARGLDELQIEQAILQIREANNLTTQQSIDEQRELLEHLKRIQQVDLERARAKGLIDNQIQSLKLQGATNLQLLEAEITLERMYGINQDRLSLLHNELNLQKEITKEKLNQQNLSSDTIKLFQIAQKYGRGTASDISQLLRGEISITAFEKGGKFSGLEDVIQEYFPNLVEQLKAFRFFFEGRGRDIPIAERTAFNQDFQPLRLESITLPEIRTDIGEIKVEVKQALNRENLSQQIVDEIVRAIQGNDRIQQAIDEKIESY